MILKKGGSLSKIYIIQESRLSLSRKTSCRASCSSIYSWSIAFSIDALSRMPWLTYQLKLFTNKHVSAKNDDCVPWSSLQDSYRRHPTPILTPTKISQSNPGWKQHLTPRYPYLHSKSAGSRTRKCNRKHCIEQFSPQVKSDFQQTMQTIDYITRAQESNLFTIPLRHTTVSW